MHITIWMHLENIVREKSQTQKKILYDSIYIKCPEEATLQRQKVYRQLPGAERRKQRLTANGNEVSFGGGKNILKLVLMFAQPYEHTKPC